MRKFICAPTTVLPMRGRHWVVTSLSIIENDRIQVLTRGLRSELTTITCRCARRHEFRRRCRGLAPVGLPPSLREAPASAPNEPNRQRLHLKILFIAPYLREPTAGAFRMCNGTDRASP